MLTVIGSRWVDISGEEPPIRQQQLLFRAFRPRSRVLPRSSFAVVQNANSDRSLQSDTGVVKYFRSVKARQAPSLSRAFVMVV